MGILNEKSNKNGIVINAENYPETLKFEILEYFSKNISGLINENGYQEALSYVEKNIGRKFEVPLRIDETVSFNGRLNELIINEKAKFMNFFVYLKNELMNCKKFYFIVSFTFHSSAEYRALWLIFDEPIIHVWYFSFSNK